MLDHFLFWVQNIGEDEINMIYHYGQVYYHQK